MAFSAIRIRRGLLCSILFGLVLSLAACGTSPPEQAYDDDEEVVYCVDDQDVIVEDEYCDEDGDGLGHFFFLSHGHHGKHHVKGHKLHSGTKVKATDHQARANLGLPPTGTVKAASAVPRTAPSAPAVPTTKPAPVEKKDQHTTARGGGKKKGSKSGGTRSSRRR